MTWGKWRRVTVLPLFLLIILKFKTSLIVLIILVLNQRIALLSKLMTPRVLFFVSVIILSSVPSITLKNPFSSMNGNRHISGRGLILTSVQVRFLKNGLAPRLVRLLTNNSPPGRSSSSQNSSIRTMKFLFTFLVG